MLALVLIGRGLQLRELFIGLDLGLGDMARLFLYLVPFFMLLVIPVACMLSVFLTFLRMSTDRELIALKAGGISIYQMLPAPVVFSVLCTCLTLAISLHWLSWGMASFRSSVMEIANSRARIVMQPGVFNQDIPGLTLFARTVDPGSGEMRQVIVEDRSRPGSALTILAPSGVTTTDEARGEIVFKLHDGRIYKAEGEQVTVLGFNEYMVRLDLDQLFKGLDLGNVKPKEMSWQQLTTLDLTEYAQENSDRYARKVIVELHKRWVLPIACIVLGLFAMPLACAFEGMKRQVGVAMALLMFLVYYSLLSLGLSMGESGTLSPAIGLWLPNALFSVVGLYGLHLTARERTPAITSFLSHIAQRRKQR